MDRRDFNRSLVGAIVTYSLLDLAFATEAIEEEIDPILREWQLDLYELCGDVRKQTLTALEWQEQIEELYSRIPLRDLLRHIDFDRIVRGMQYPDNRGVVRNVSLPAFEGLPEHRGFGSKIFGYKRGTATAPHAHNNLVSAHLVLRGTFRVRTYERLADEPDHLIIAPTLDGDVDPGRTISMSDERDNVHWFLATSDHAYTFDVPVPGVYPGRHYATEANRFGMIYVDPAGDRIGEGRIRAPVLTFEQALARYGGSHLG